MRKEITAAGSEQERTGIFTTSIISKTGQRQIVLFFTGQKRAGENLNQLLQRWAAGSGQPTQMSIRQLPGHHINAEMEKLCLCMFTACSMFT
jgi:hypothetical protein